MNLFKNISKRAKLLTLGAVLVLTASVAMVPAISKAGSGPDRPTKAYSDGVAGFDHVTFNSFTGVPGIGNEENFFNGKYAGSSAYTDPLPQVKDGDDLTLEVYVHNNADSSLNDGGTGVAKNTQVRVALPSGTAKSQQATAYVSADNATPKVVTDTLDFGAADGGAFKLNYIAGSASLQYKDANGNSANRALSDNVVSSGTQIGPDLNGQMKGCFNYVEYVTIHVKVSKPKPNFTLTKTVALPGDKQWSKSVVAQPGQTVKYELTYKNTGQTTYNDVVLRDQLPKGVTIVPGSSKLYTDTQNGAAQTDAIVANGGQDIGNYAPGSGAYFDFEAKMPTADKLTCGTNTLTNIGQAIAGGVDVTDTANVTINKECTPTTPSYSCDLFHVVVDNTGRTVKVDQFNTSQAGGATFNNVVINWGDKTNGASNTLTTNNAVGQMHTYGADGTYAITATAHFTVNGSDKIASSANCAQTVTFTTPGTPNTPNTPSTPTELPNTGAGNVVALGLGAIVAGTVAGRLFLSRKLARKV